MINYIDRHIGVITQVITAIMVVIFSVTGIDSMFSIIGACVLIYVFLTDKKYKISWYCTFLCGNLSVGLIAQLIFYISNNDIVNIVIIILIPVCSGWLYDYTRRKSHESCDDDE